MKPLAESAAGGNFACVNAVKTSRISKSVFIGLLCLLIGIGSASGATVTSNGTGNWSTLTTWPTTNRAGTITATTASATVTGTGTAFLSDVSVGTSIQTQGGATLGTVQSITDNTHIILVANSLANAAGVTWRTDGSPGAGDDVIIAANNNVTVNGSYSCVSVSLGTTNNTAVLTFNSGSFLTVSGIVTLGNSGSNNRRGSIIMTAGGTLTCAGLALGNAGINIWTPGTGTVILSATNTLPSTIFTSFNNLSITGGTTTQAANLSIAGNLNIGTGATMDLATFIANRSAVGGSLTVAGTMILGGTAGGQGGNSNFPTNYSTVTLAGGTVNYDNAGAQTVYGINYCNLTLSGSGAKTLQTGTTSITGDLTLAGTATTVAVIGLAIGADVVLGTGTTFDAATFTYTVGGNWTNNGGVFTQGASTINFIGNNSLINGTAATQTFNNLVETKLTGQTLTVNGSTTTLAINGFYTLTSGDFYAPATMTVAGDITLTSGNLVAGTSLTVSGNWENNGALLYPQNGTVIFNGANKVIKGNTSNTFDNLTINNANGIFLGCSQTVNKVLNLTSGRLTLGISNLTLGAVATVTGTFGPTNMIVTDDIGEMRKVFTSTATSFTFPVGEATGTIEYTPITLNFTSGTYGSGAYASARVVNAIHPANSGTTNYLKRYWDVNQSGITAFSCNVTGTYAAADVIGSITNLKSSRYTGVLPWTFYTALSANTLTASAVTTFGDFSGVDSSVSTPVIAISVTQLYGFSYNLGSGPSAQQSFAVSGQFLTNNVLVTPPTDYEISTTSGSGFQSTAITLTRVGGVVNATIYVRLKAGLSVAAYNTENIAITSSPATTQNIPCFGFVRPSVTANASPSAVCEGSSIALTSTGSTFTNKYWTGPNGFYAANDSTIPSATFAMSGTYTVNANVLTGNNIVFNGDFSAGVSGFSSSYTNNQTDLVPEGDYAVITNPHNVHTGFWSMGDHTTGTGLQMVVNGYVTPNVNVWSQTVSVTPGTDFQFTYYIATVALPSPSMLQLYVNGMPAGPVYVASLTQGKWTQFLYNWNSGASTTAVLSLVNQNTVANGNDFTLDDIVFKQVLTASSSANVTVNQTIPVGVSLAASANPVTQGTTVVYTATPVNGGTLPVYAWKVNGVTVSGVTGSTYSYVPNNNDIITCQLTSSNTCATGNPATANTISMTVTPGANYWMGSLLANGTDWGTASNWTATTIPATNANVIYATVANYGTAAINDLVLDQDRTIGSLINATTKRLIIPPKKSLVVNNTITITNSTNPDLVYIQSTSTLPTGSLIYHNDSISPVYATVEMYSKANWDLTQTVRSKYNWQYFGIPVAYVDLDPTFFGSYVREWHEEGTDSTNHWVQLNNQSIVKPFYGYELCQAAPKIITYKGQLINKNFKSGKLPYTYYGVGNLSNSKFPGQNIFANPYVAGINIKKLVFGLETEASVYMYNTGTFKSWQSGGQSTGLPTNNVTPGQYTVVPKNTAGSNSLPAQVPAMQAMLIKAKSNSINAKFEIYYDSVVVKDTVMQRVSGIGYSNTSDNVSTMIEVKGENYSDKMWMFTNPVCTRHFDDGWDGLKMAGSSLVPQIFALGTDGNYQVNAVNDINNTELAFQAGEDVEYTMTFTHENTKRYYTGIYLVDLIENRTIDITETGSQYSFVASSSPNPIVRFKIVTRYYEKNASDSHSEIKVFSSKGMIFVDNQSNQMGEMMIFDISGHFLKRIQFGANSVTTASTGLIPGAYIGRCVTVNETVAKRLIVQ